MKKSIRTLIALLAVAAVVLSFAACGSKTSGSDATDPTETASEAASDTSAAPGTTATATPADAARAALSDAIADARAYYDSIKNDEALAEVADDLDTRLQRAEALLASSSTTADELVTAASDVIAALTAAKEQTDVTTKTGDTELYDTSGEPDPTMGVETRPPENPAAEVCWE